MRRVTILLAALLAAGCMGGDEAALEKRDLGSVVLQPGDVPRAFVRFDEGQQVRTDLPGGERADPARFGRLAGWKARYKRSGTTETRGPLVIESRVDLFESSDGADEELDTEREELEEGSAREGGAAKVIEAPELGDEALAATIVQAGAQTPVRFYLLAWRYGNATATVFVNGFEGKLSLEDVVALAREQQRRLERAAER